MIHVGLGMSQQKDALLAAQEALQQAFKSFETKQIDWGLVFFTTPYFSKATEIHQWLIHETNCSSWSGCSGAGIIANDVEVISDAGLVLMIGTSPNWKTMAFQHQEEGIDGPSVSQQLKESLEKFGGTNPVTFLFPDAYKQQPYNLINTLNYVKTHPFVFGGGACDDGSRRKSVLIGPKAISTEGISGLCIDGIEKFNVGVTQSCVPIGEPMFITGVEDNVIQTLDGFPALEVFSTLAVNQGFEDFDTAAQHILLAFPLDNQSPEFMGESCVVRHLSGIDIPAQGLTVPQIVEEGGVLSMMYRDSTRAEFDLENMLQRLKEKNGEIPTFGIYFNCMARGENLYGRSNVDPQAIYDTLGEFPLIGFLGSFEMASVPSGLQLYSYTGVLLLIYD